MEIVLNKDDLNRSGSSKPFRDLDLSDFYTMDLRMAGNAHKISFIYGKEKHVLKDRYGRGR